MRKPRWTPRPRDLRATSLDRTRVAAEGLACARTTERVEREREADSAPRTVDTEPDAVPLPDVKAGPHPFPREQAEEPLEAGFRSVRALPLESSPGGCQADLKASARCLSANRSRGSQAAEASIQRASPQFRGPEEFRPRPRSLVSKDLEDLPVHGIRPSSEEPLRGWPEELRDEQAGAPIEHDAPQDPTRLEPCHVGPQGIEGRNQESGRGAQVDARIRGRGQEEFQAARVQEGHRSSRPHRFEGGQVLHVEGPPEGPGEVDRRSHRGGKVRRAERAFRFTRPKGPRTSRPGPAPRPLLPADGGRQAVHAADRTPSARVQSVVDAREARPREGARAAAFWTIMETASSSPSRGLRGPSA